MWQATFNGANHCGAGCALGDSIGDWLAFATGFMLFGNESPASFCWPSCSPIYSGGSRCRCSPTQIDMFAWMGLRAWLYPDPQPTTWTHWLKIQIAMIVGFLTTIR